MRFHRRTSVKRIYIMSIGMLSVKSSHYFWRALQLLAVLPHIFPWVPILDRVDFAHLRLAAALAALLFDALREKVEIVEYCHEDVAHYEKRRVVVELVGRVADQVVKAEDNSDGQLCDAVQKRSEVAALRFVGFFADDGEEFDGLQGEDGEELVLPGAEED